MYRLRVPTIGVVEQDGKRLTITIPANAVLELTTENFTDGMVDVIWNDLRISVFAIDLAQRGQAVRHGARDKHA
jgi:hypothetical protein